MTPEELRVRWRALTADERRFVRVVAALGETAGTDAGNELVAAYAARRLRRFRLAARALVAVAWSAYLAVACTVLRAVPGSTLGAVAVLSAAVQAFWLLRTEERLERAVTANRA